MSLLLPFLFFLGAVVGSFLHVVIDRVPKGESIVYPPSHCPHCRHRLAWYDLIPVVSYILLQGKCRYCHAHISYYYPVLEVLTGALFVFVFLFGMQTDLVYTVYLLFVTSIFVIIFFTDFKYGIIPIYSIVIGIMFVSTYLVYSSSIETILSHVYSSLGAFLFFFFLFAITKGRGMGFGDVLLVLLLGLFLGFPNVAVALYVSFLTGAAISLILIGVGGKKFRHDTIPFGPFLISGAFFALFWGNTIVRALMDYMRL